MLESILPLFAPHAAAILADETGDVAAQVVEALLPTLDSVAADWLFDNWDAVLDAL